MDGGCMVSKHRIDVDVLVVGGGMAGCAAALAAVRKGARVALAEKSSYLGGMATKSQFAEMNGVMKGGGEIYRGIPREIMNLLVEGGGRYMLQVPMSSNPAIRVDRLRYNPEVLKLLLERLLVDAGVRILLNAPCGAASEETGAGVEIAIRDQYNDIALRGSVLVDCTGNADVAHMLGYATLKTCTDEIQTATSVFWLTGADLERVGAFVAGDGMAEVVRRGYERGVLKGRILALTPIPGTSSVAVNATRAERVDHESILSTTEAILETHAQIPGLVGYLRESVEGLERAALSFVSPELGVRDSRRIKGRYTLTGADLIELRAFDDAVAVGGYPIDMHDAKTKGVVWMEVDGVYGIPYSCMVPQSSGRTVRTIVSGKAVSADREAFGAIRVIPVVTNMGEAAGHAAYLSWRDGVPVDRVDVEELKALQEIGRMEACASWR